MVVLVTGGFGQLGQAIKSIAGKYPELSFHFADSAQADVTDEKQLASIFKELKPDFCINASAYTAVDKAESEPEKAYAINVTGASNLAKICKEFKTTLIHISTDFVFDGKKTTPYTEEDQTNPQGVYGQTKRSGESEIERLLAEHYIIRTSWLYSEFANNFMKTMLKLSETRDSLNVVSDQIGTPTDAVDLAEAILFIILSDKKAYGIYHFSNEGEASWYDFAAEIFRVNNVAIQVNPIPTTEYPTPAMRPKYSVLDKSKIKEVFGIEIEDWQKSLQKVQFKN